MSENEKIELYENQPIRTAWIEAEEEWDFFRCGCCSHTDGQPGLQHRA